MAVGVVGRAGIEHLTVEVDPYIVGLKRHVVVVDRTFVVELCAPQMDVECDGVGGLVVDNG